ncbi:hypothetical protein NCC49_006245 [Naganishia albida]|nr:hypothetical protein NCC49_006245 [Naganishia albida]
MHSNYATGRDHAPISPDANANLPLSPPGKTVYMPESPVTTGDKRIQQLKELQIPHADKKRVILGHAFGKSHSRQRPPRMAQRKKALLLNETDEERRKRERESVEAWRAWAAACVASNYITPRQSLPRTHLGPDTPTRKKQDRSGRHPLSRSASPRSSQQLSMHVNGTEAPLKAGSLDMPRTKSLERSFLPDFHDWRSRPSSRRPSLRQAYTDGVEVSIRFFPKSVELSPRQVLEEAIEPPVQLFDTEGRPNYLLALRNRLASSIIRTILLELVHAVACYLEAVSATGQPPAEESKDPVTFCDEAVRRARRVGILDNTPASDRDFWRDEVRELWFDLESVAGKPRYIRSIYKRGEYDKAETLEAFKTSDEEYPRLLVDLEELMWGGLEPPEEELPYAWEVEEQLKLTGQQERSPSIAESSVAGSRRASANSQAISTSHLSGRRRIHSVWANDFLSALQEGDDADAPAHPLTNEPVEPLDFSQLGDDWTSACPGVKLVPGLTTLDLDLNALPVDPPVPGRGRAAEVSPSRVPSRAPSRRGSSKGSGGASGKTKEQLAEEGRARFEAWKASRQVQPLK